MASLAAKCGFVAIVGRPNVGKSTLLNRMVGEKLAGISPKPQTTRETIRGILTRPQGQIIFLDTPGFHDPRDSLGQWMIREVGKSIESADLVLFMVLPGPIHLWDEKILKEIRSHDAPALLIVNQTDRFPKPHILPVLDHYRSLYAFRDMIPISAKKGDQIGLLTEKILEHLPEGAPLFPEDQISDQQERLFVTEMIREKLFLYTGEEIPYAAAVTIDSFREREDGLIHIDATIAVEKDSQKGIVIGKGGAKLKQIGVAARLDIERFLGKKIFLGLRVKTVLRWKSDEAALRRLGFK